MRSVISTSVIVLSFVAGTTLAAPSRPRSFFQVRNQVDSAFTGVGGNSPGGSINGNPNDGGPLLNVLSENAGSGGYASSGDSGSRLSGVSTGHGSHGKSTNRGKATINGASVDSAYSGAGGQSPGGSVNGGDGLINVLSANAGNGGVGDSGSSNAGLV